MDVSGVDVQLGPLGQVDTHKADASIDGSGPEGHLDTPSAMKPYPLKGHGPQDGLLTRHVSLAGSNAVLECSKICKLGAMFR